MNSSWKPVIVSGFLFLIVLVFTLTLIPREVSAATIVVAQDGSGDYTSIQEAIDAAEDGDTIRVYEGTYHENIVVNRSVSLTGNGSGVTIINGGRNGDTVYITADRVNISRFKVTGSGDYSIGILVESNNNTVSNNTISNNNYFGIYINSSRDNTIANNICSNNEIGIHLRSADFNILNSNNCSNNGKDGFNLFLSDDNLLFNNTLSDNDGHGIMIHASSMNTFNNNTISNNEINCIYIVSSARYNTLANNKCINNKYGITYDKSDGNTLIDNVVISDDDGHFGLFAFILISVAIFFSFVVYIGSRYRKHGYKVVQGKR